MTTDRSGAGAVAPDPHDPAWTSGELIGGKYRVEKLIGRGGMGAVYAAMHVETGRRVAVKAVLSDVAKKPEGRLRLMREARAVAKIEHPNVVDVLDVGHHDDVPFMVMELLEGESLESIVGRGPIAPADAIRLLVPAMRGIAAAHAIGVVHRDLKPDNIFLCRSPSGRIREVKVLDFGISKTYDAELHDTNLTRSGAILGTPKYMAPEQLANEPIDQRADVYALGVILYEAISGRLPFEGATFALLATSKLMDRPVPLSKYVGGVDPRLEAAILKAIARSPDDRHRDVPSFARVLATFADGVEVGSGGIAMPEPLVPPHELVTAPTVVDTRAVRPRAALKWALLAGAALAVVAAGVLVGWALFDRPPREATVVPLEDPVQVAEPAAPAEPSRATPEPSEPEPPVEAPPEVSDPAPEAPTMESRRPAKRGRTGRLSWDDF